ncbi:MAG: hypothetical protein ABIU05_22065 [Nitrospirales bacterium]
MTVIEEAGNIIVLKKTKALASTEFTRDWLEVNLVLSNEPKFLITAKIKEFSIPPITDGLIIGKEAAIGVSALQKALKLLIPEEFDHIEIQDEVINSLLIRCSIIKRLSEKRVVAFLLQQVKPLMSVDEIFHIQLDTEITITQEL